VQQNDYEMMDFVLAEIDIITEVDLCSDRLGPKDLSKMEMEYARELRNDKKCETKQSIWKYV